MSLVFSLLLFSGILGEYAIFAFVYPVLVFVYFVLDVFITMISTDLIARALQNKTACMFSIVARDLVIIGVWLSILMNIDICVIIRQGQCPYSPVQLYLLCIPNTPIRRCSSSLADPTDLSPGRTFKVGDK